jgi:oligopeptide/dipeptide ABC transporter ATP-binding protein
LEKVCLKIFEKETYGLVGETGCGKSVTALSILQLVPEPGKIVEGEIYYKDQNLLKLSDKEIMEIRGKEIAMVFQDPLTYLNPVLTIGEQISETIILHQNIEKNEAHQKTLDALNLVRMPYPEKIVNQYPHELSGGMRQRAIIAMGISCNPSLLILDEATTALDVTIQAQIFQLLNELKDKINMSLLVITHDLGLVAENCNRIAVMYAGTVIENATTKKLFKNPLHPYTKGLLNAIPKIQQSSDTLEIIPGNVPNLIHPPSGCRFNPRCKYAKEICKNELPEMKQFEKDHNIACHLYS